MRKMNFSGGAVFGIVLIAVGVVSLLGSLNYFDSWDIFSTYWPLVIVLFGVKHMIDHRSSTMFGLVLILVGTFLQVDELNLWYLGDINIRELIFPVIIILIGLSFIVPRRKDGEVEVEVETAETKTSVKEDEAPKAEESEDAESSESETVRADHVDADFVNDAD